MNTLKHTLLAATAAAALGLAGCTTSISPIPSSSKEEAAQLAAYAAKATYPTETNAADLHVAVVIRGNVVRLTNFTDQSIQNANAWINGLYVHHIDSIPAQQSVSINKSDFYDKTGAMFSQASVAASRITIQQGDKLSSTLGPVNE